MIHPHQELHAFVEAHYYNYGLEHHHSAASKERPTWAPPPGTVGFLDEFPLHEGDFVIEFSRRMFLGEPITWIGLYTRSPDEVIGDRGNHAGVGLWLLKLSITDMRNVIQGLRLLLLLVAGKFDRAKFDQNAQRFLSGKFLPQYVRQTNEFPAKFRGADYSNSELSPTSIFVTDCTNGSLDEMFNWASDELLNFTFGLDVKGHPRLLIHLPKGDKLPPLKENMQLIGNDTDWMSAMVSALPVAVEEMSANITSLSTTLVEKAKSLEAASNQISGLQDSLKKAEIDRDTALQRLKDLERNLSINMSVFDAKLILGKLDDLISRHVKLENTVNGINIRPLVTTTVGKKQPRSEGTIRTAASRNRPVSQTSAGPGLLKVFAVSLVMMIIVFAIYLGSYELYQVISQ